ncbi:hypothetical protein J8273_5110 [Carpediemonas membranifera]|uniref:Uncharacterized protein n=1 Tax=Carpediemonas membranifera TaxID=201153 RepID=A0A8J6AR33_9EUKA|nr:hypothetical protein J8273_5110 [Carpediemonas membranifera]|eukprot:KAG9392131.1 hypothetical protein J8273_5110 [Carpediemonas membranifera]
MTNWAKAAQTLHLRFYNIKQHNNEVPSAAKNASKQASNQKLNGINLENPVIRAIQEKAFNKRVDTERSNTLEDRVKTSEFECRSTTDTNFSPSPLLSTAFGRLFEKFDEMDGVKGRPCETTYSFDTCETFRYLGEVDTTNPTLDREWIESDSSNRNTPEPDKRHGRKETDLQPIWFSVAVFIVMYMLMTIIPGRVTPYHRSNYTFDSIIDTRNVPKNSPPIDATIE